MISIMDFHLALFSSLLDTVIFGISTFPIRKSYHCLKRYQTFRTLKGFN